MKPSSIAPRVQLFVCTNVRAAEDPLKSACGAHGLPVFNALRAEASRLGVSGAVWITRSGCLGHCPRDGCSVVVYPRGGQWTDVRTEDTEALLREAITSNTTPRR